MKRATTTATLTAAAVTLTGCGTPHSDPITLTNPNTTCHYQIVDAAKGFVLPDPKCTPGALDPAVTQDTIHSTICRSGWTKTRRPGNLTAVKRRVSQEYTGRTTWDKTVELDHFIPLELGGAPSDVRNLFPEPNAEGATSSHNPKDRLENALRRDVCGGRDTLAHAQHVIADDWVEAYQDRYGTGSHAITGSAQRRRPSLWQRIRSRSKDSSGRASGTRTGGTTTRGGVVVRGR